MFLFLIFIPRRSPSRTCLSTQAKEAIACVAFCLVHFVATLMAGTVITWVYPNKLQSFANSQGVIASLCGVVQYFPQIWYTWKLQRIGSLSVPMMCAQTPGGFLFAASLFTRLGWAGWSTWIVYIVLAILQGVLLGMAIWFRIRDRRENKNSEEEEEEDDEESIEDEQATTNNERSPLLRRNTGKSDNKV